MPKKKNEDNRENQKYWEKRARLDKLKVIKTGEQGIDNLKKLLSYNLKSVQRQIKEFYEKYGDNPAENLSYEEFKQYKRKLGLKAKANPQDKTLQRIARQDIPKYRIDRLRALETDLQIMLTEATNGQQRGIYNTLKDVASVSEATAVKRFANGLDLVFDRIAGKKLEKILSSNWSGKVWSDRLWTDRAKVGQKVTAILEEGIPQGFSMQKMTRELQQATGQSFNNAFRLIRTESSFVDSSVALANYEEAEKELGIEYYQYDAFLDERTSEICREMHKKIFKISEMEIGVNAPPLHPNCRSCTTLVLDNDYKEPITKLTEFTDFKKFNQKSYSLAQHVKNATSNSKDAVKMARSFYDKNTLNSYIKAGNLDKQQMAMLGTKTSEIKLSMDSMIKNRINHPDINFYDYKKINEIITNPDNIKISKRGTNGIILIKKDNKKYQVVIKTTKDRKENYITSFRYAEH